MHAGSLMRGKSLINTLVGVSASWGTALYSEGSLGLEAMIRKKTPSTNMKVYYGKQYSALKGVAATIKSPATPDKATVQILQIIVQTKLLANICCCSKLSV